MASSSRAFRKPKNAEEERKLLEMLQHQVSNILGPPENLETTGKASNAEVMGNDMESLLPADLNFEISDDVSSNMPLPDYGSNVIQNFSGSVFNNCQPRSQDFFPLKREKVLGTRLNNCTINFVQK